MSRKGGGGKISRRGGGLPSHGKSAGKIKTRARSYVLSALGIVKDKGGAMRTRSARKRVKASRNK